MDTGYPYRVKTTIDIADPLFERARRLARERGTTLRALVEDGLRRVLDERGPAPFTLPDRAVGVAGEPDPTAPLTWAELRAEIYGP
jgi:hypothetical protein